ncbi:MAG TPA: 50S ribosomal protein L24 [Tepidisphaeraceae bacterium]|jgi:large subunit ribosomal protein L24
MGQRIKKGDTVVVISGADKGKTGTVKKIDAKDGRLIVDGINRVWKHVKPNQKFPQGGRMQKEAPIHASNVQPVDPSTGRGTKVKFELRDGKKVRVAKKGGTVLGNA